jgi:hypothetical protein
MTGRVLQRLRKSGRARATGFRSAKLNPAAERQEHIEAQGRKFADHPDILRASKATRINTR